MAEAKLGHLLNLRCQIAHPHHCYILSPELCRLSFFSFLPIIENQSCWNVPSQTPKQSSQLKEAI